MRWVFALPLACAMAVAGRAVNVTIDDTFGDEQTGRKPQYTGLWRAQNIQGGCKQCVHNPDVSLARNFTWHSANTLDNGQGGGSATVTLTFTGSAIWVYFILANLGEKAPRGTHVSFSLDGQSPTNFDFEPTATGKGYTFDNLVFSNTATGAGEHTLLITNVGPAKGNSLLFFDYAMYQVDDLVPNPGGGASSDAPPNATGSPLPSAHQRAVSGILAGAVMGGTAVAIILAALAYWLVLRRRRRQAQHAQVMRSSAMPAYFRMQDQSPRTANRPASTAWTDSSMPVNPFETGWLPRGDDGPPPYAVSTDAGSTQGDRSSIAKDRIV